MTKCVLHVLLNMIKEIVRKNVVMKSFRFWHRADIEL